jgi:hypothetical protein
MPTQEWTVTANLRDARRRKPITVNDQQSTSFLHIILLLILALTNFVVTMNRRTLTDRIDTLERLLTDFTEDVEKQTPKD